MTLLGGLSTLAPTVERESLYGSGYKRLALLEAAAARLADDPDAKAAAEKAEQAAIDEMWTCYKAAETLAKEKPSASAQPLFYPAMNRIAAQLTFADATKRQEAMDHDAIALVLGSMRSVPPDFWSVVGQTELAMYLSIASGLACTRCGPPDRRFPRSPCARRQRETLELSLRQRDVRAVEVPNARRSSRSGCRGAAARRARHAGGPGDAAGVHGSARRGGKRRPGGAKGRQEARREGAAAAQVRSATAKACKSKDVTHRSPAASSRTVRTH